MLILMVIDRFAGEADDGDAVDGDDDGERQRSENRMFVPSKTRETDLNDSRWVRCKSS